MISTGTEGIAGIAGVGDDYKVIDLKASLAGGGDPYFYKKLSCFC